MKANLKVILSAVGLAALLTPYAMAQQAQPRNAAPSTIRIPSDARGSVAPPVNEGGPYTPSVPTSRNGDSRDFQNTPQRQ